MTFASPTFRSPWFASLARAQQALTILLRTHHDALLHVDQFSPMYCVIWG